MRFYCSGVRRFLHPGFAVLLEMRLLVFSPRDHTPARRLDRRPWRWSMPKVLIIGNQSFKSAFAHVAFKGLKPGEQFIVQDKTSWARTPRCVRWVRWHSRRRWLASSRSSRDCTCRLSPRCSCEATTAAGDLAGAPSTATESAAVTCISAATVPPEPSPAQQCRGVLVHVEFSRSAPSAPLPAPSGVSCFSPDASLFNGSSNLRLPRCARAQSW